MDLLLFLRALSTQQLDHDAFASLPTIATGREGRGNECDSPDSANVDRLEGV